ncbi:MAG TPA: DUF4350 domain-containing protein [Chitinophagaceae bacterium]|nr:DUF4350 domain-containing protein [Chitinophagaceae bacterium]
MKKYRFYIIFCVLLALYILLAVFRPKQLDWTVTLQGKDKNPYGAYILYHQLKDLFPSAVILTDRLPVYSQLRDSVDRRTAYLLIAPELPLHPEDIHRLLKYVAGGNDAFIATYSLGTALSDTLHLRMSGPVHNIFRTDSLRVNFTNQRLATDSGYLFRKFTLDNYFKKIDTARAEVLGVLSGGQADFIRMKFGKGYLYVHAAPLCFSNYFMVFGNNDAYTAGALSYLPRDIKTIYWDEYYKQGADYSGSVMNFFLTHRFLRWAWWLALLTTALYLLFASKRRQRVIPEMDPMTNTSLDFVKTVGNLYFNRKDNKNIADKKMTHFLEFVRARLYLSTSHLDQEFIVALARKSDVDVGRVTDLVNLMIQAQTSPHIGSELLSQLNRHIDDFYKKVK